MHMEEIHCCRLCWGEADVEAGGRLISPCSCTGSMRYIHQRCLSNWLDVVREQGQMKRAQRCEVCRAPYGGRYGPRSAGLGSFMASLHCQLSDPWVWAASLHLLLRGVVALTGARQATDMYRGALAPARRRLEAAGAAGGAPPALGAAAAATAAAAAASTPGLRFSPGVVEAIRTRFERATMVQVCSYTSALALVPQPPLSDALSGMALGAVIGGVVSELLFLPLLGVRHVAAAASAAGLVRVATLRLAAGAACGPRGLVALARLCAGVGRAVRRGAALRLLLQRRQRPQAPPGAQRP